MPTATSLLAACIGAAVLLRGGSALPAQEDADQSPVIEIDAAGILDQPGATYRLTKDVTVPRTALMIKGDRITLDLGGHTVTYGTELGIDRTSGVFLRPSGGEEAFRGVPAQGFGGGDDFTLRNGRIVQGRQPLATKLTTRGGRIVEAEGPQPGRSCFAVYVRGCRGLEITGITTEVNSRDTDNFYIRECSDVEVHGNHCISEVREITDRHWPGTGVITVAGFRGPADIHHNVIDGGGHCSDGHRTLWRRFSANCQMGTRDAQTVSSHGIEYARPIGEAPYIDHRPALWGATARVVLLRQVCRGPCSIFAGGSSVWLPLLRYFGDFLAPVLDGTRALL